MKKPLLGAAALCATVGALLYFKTMGALAFDARRDAVISHTPAYDLRCKPGCDLLREARYEEGYQWFLDQVEGCDGEDCCPYDWREGEFLGRGFEGVVQLTEAPCPGSPPAVVKHMVKVGNKVSLTQDKNKKECDTLKHLAKVSDACGGCFPRYYLGTTAGNETHNRYYCLSSFNRKAVKSTDKPVARGFLRLLPADHTQAVALAKNVMVKAFEMVAMLDEAHVLQGDFKPGNLLITNSSRDISLTLVDFGLAATNSTYDLCASQLDKTLREWTTGEAYSKRFGPDKETHWRGPCTENVWGMGRLMTRFMFGNVWHVDPEWIKTPGSVLDTLARVTERDFSKRLRDVPTVLQRLRDAEEWA